MGFGILRYLDEVGVKYGMYIRMDREGFIHQNTHRYLFLLRFSLFLSFVIAIIAISAQKRTAGSTPTASLFSCEASNLTPAPRPMYGWVPLLPTAQGLSHGGQ